MTPRVFNLRFQQLESLAKPKLEVFIDELTQRFDDGRAPVSGGRDALRPWVEAEVQRGRSYGLRSARALTGFVALACIYGARFETTPRHAWMRAQLEDTRVSRPDQRMALLMDECIRRSQVEQNNARARWQFGQTPSSGAANDPGVVPLPAPFTLLEASA